MENFIFCVVYVCVCSIPDWANSLLISGSVEWTSVIQKKDRSLTKHWNLSETKQRIEIPSHVV